MLGTEHGRERKGIDVNHLPQRFVFFTLGVVINSFGVALITKGALGTSAISSVPYVVSLQWPCLSFGAAAS